MNTHQAVALLLTIAVAVEVEAQTTYEEARRPQFHFTAPAGFLGDPNGLFYLGGTYHLYYQHNPGSTHWTAPMYWAHAVSADLVQWTNLPIALSPDSGLDPWSGSCVVDWDNTAGFREGNEAVVVAMLTRMGAGGGQSLAFSRDSGMTWTYDGRYAIPMRGDTRDPKVFWHAPTNRWVMTLHYGLDGAGVYTSPDLKRWTLASVIPASVSSGECPDLYELPVDGNRGNMKWVFPAGYTNRYSVGTFDGTTFAAEGTYPIDLVNICNTMTFSDIPASDGRRISVNLLTTYYGGQVWGGQMSFPVVHTLRTFPEGVRLCQNPVAEIAHLYAGTSTFADVTPQPGVNILSGISGRLFDIKCRFIRGSSTSFGFLLRANAAANSGARIEYNRGSGTLDMTGLWTSYASLSDTVDMRILLDWNTIEVFMDGGRARATKQDFQPADADSLLTFFVSGNLTGAKVLSLEVNRLRSAWHPPATQALRAAAALPHIARNAAGPTEWYSIDGRRAVVTQGHRPAVALVRRIGASASIAVAGGN